MIITKGPLPLAAYKAAIVDIPWRFEVYSDKGMKKSATSKYPTMTEAEAIAFGKELGVEWCFDPDCVALFWCPSWAMANCTVHRVARAWGFTPISMGSWFKITSRGKDTFGNGYIFRDNMEPYLVCTRGEPGLPKNRSIRNGFRALRREHSRKPPYLHVALEKMYPRGPFVEIFGREERKGWDTFGNEIGLFEGKSERALKVKQPEPAPILEYIGQP